MSEELPQALVQKKALVKTARAVVRLRYSLMADKELNRLLPRLEMEFDKALHAGEITDDEDIVAIVKRVVG